MASVLPPPPTPSPVVVTDPRSDERLVDEQIRRTRRSLKFVDFFSGLLTLTIGVLVFLLFASVMEHWVIPGGWNAAGRLVLFSTMLVGIAWYSWRTFWPLVSQAINPAYAAQLIERSTPSLKNSLLNFLLLRNRRQQLSQKVYQAIEQQAAQGLSRVSLDSVVDRSTLLRLGYALVVVVAICAIYRVLSPKNLTASMERVLLPWSNIAVPARVEILKVTPGDTEIARGESLEVSAEVMGLREGEAVRVRYSTLDNQAVDREVTLNGVEGTTRFQGRLPDRFSVGGSSTESNGGGVQQDLEYWIEAGDAKSEKFRVTVFARPTLVVERIRYQFPHYTGLPPREVEGTGDVSAIEGTQVSIYALANHDIDSANVDFNADGRHDLPMTADKMKANAQFTLELQEDRRTPQYDSYVLQYKTTNGRSSSLPPKYSIDVTPDYAPEVKIIAPVDEEGKLVEQLDVPMDTPFTVEVEARDPDFALKNVVVLGEVAGAEVLKHELLTKEQSGKFVGRMTATPKELNLKLGDVMDYSAMAIDNREPEPNITRTEKLRIRVVGPPQFGERPQGQQQQGDGQQSGESGEGGQGQEGMQGPGEAGGSGENGEQQGQGQAGAEGEQQGQGESAGEQQGQGGQAGSEGEQQGESSSNNGESPSADGNKQSDEQQSQPQPGQQGENQAGDQQDGQQQPDSSGQGGEQQQPQEGAGEQGKVSAEGDDDGAAFDKMSEHFAEKDSESQGQGQSSKAGGDAEQSESQNKNEAGQGDGQGSPDQQEPTAESGRNQDQGIDGAQEGEESEGSGAEGQPNEQREQQQSDAEQGDEGEKQEAPGGKMSTEQGEQGAGNNPGENDGSMDTDSGRKARDKSDKGSPKSEINDEEAPGQSNSQQENDSRGSQGGDNSGGGQEGAGQQADAEGTGAAGENTAADDGAGQAAEQGAGENSSQAGQQGESEKPTGESSETKPGEGSKQSEQPGGNKPGGEQTGQAAGGEQQQGEPEGSQGAEAGDEKQPGESASAEDEQPQQPPENGPPSGKPGQQSPTGGTGGNPSGPPPAGELEPGDAANLDYTKKQTDLVLDRLEEQLEKQEVDKNLLEKLGWTEDELRRFVERWKSLKAEAAAAPSEETKQQLDNALRSLGLNPNRRTGYQSNVTKEKLRQLQDSYRGQIPLEYADQVRAYIKGTATAGEGKEE